MGISGAGFRLSEEGIEEVKSEIDRQGLSHRRLAEMSSISETTIHRALRGKEVNQDLLNKLLSCLGFDKEVKTLLIERYPTENRLGGVQVLESTINHVFIERNDAVKELSEAMPDDIQAIASAQLKILDSYHREVLIQAKNSFRWALISSGAGFLFFLASVVFLLYEQPRNQAIIPLVSGTVIEVIAGVNFYLYGRATTQLSSFHRKLDQTQRFLLANSMCESLDGEAKQTARAELVKTVSSLPE
jgi:transcriptional regulator with XRE-family HTH domain